MIASGLRNTYLCIVKQNEKEIYMKVQDLIDSGIGVHITLTPKELIEVIDYVVEKTKLDLEYQFIKKSQEEYLTSNQVCEFLKINTTTLWRWEKKEYLKPIYIGGKKRYSRSAIEKRFTEQ